MTAGLAQDAPPQEPTSRVVQVDADHLQPLAEIIRQAWDPKATPERVRASRAAAAALNPHGAGTDLPTFLFLMNGRPLGHLTTIPVNLTVGDAVHPAHWFKGFWVVPEHRNGPVGFLLLREALRHLQTTLSMVVQPAPRRLFQSLGLRDFGQIPNFVRVLRPGRVLRRINFSEQGLAIGPSWARPVAKLATAPGFAQAIGLAAAAALKTWTLRQPGRRGVAEISPQSLEPGEVDRLWQRVSTGMAAPLRDYAHVQSRYVSKGATYTALVARDGGELSGLALIRRPRESGDPRLSGIRMATLSDLVFPPDQPQTGMRLLAAAERAALDLGADALLCSPSHSTMQPLMRARGYVRLGGNVHFMARAAGFDLDGLELTDWWLMRADGEADDAL